MNAPQAEPEFTVEEIERGIGTALREGQDDVAVSLIKMLTARDPARAEVILDAIALLAGTPR